MIKYTIYVVDDDDLVMDGIISALGTEYKLKAFSTAEDVLRSLKKELPDLILLDIGLPGMDGIEALAKIKVISSVILVIMITAFEDIDTVISAMKQGAYDYVVKPLHLDTLKATIQKALETIRLRKEVQLLQESYLKENIPCFIAESDAIQDVMDFIGKVAKSPDTPILIIGETGTGKELIASAIHFRSPNYKGPFVTVNCAAIPKDLIESELFGYEKGAFTGAKASGKKGLIEEAASGTLFLDEVGDLSPEAQAKLLRFLEAGEFYRVGGTKKLHVQTRVVSATNKDIDDQVEKNLFRKDLYFRLGVIKVEVPLLSERRGDIMPIAKHYLIKFSKKFRKKFTGFTAEAERTLLEYNWAGNVRELRNVIERGALVGKGPKLASEDFGIEAEKEDKSLTQREGEAGYPPLLSEGVDFPSIQASFEKHYIKEALKLAKGNESKAAKLLNINHHTFRYRKKKLGVE